MYCKHCGSSIDGKSAFCRFCGKPLDTAKMNKTVAEEEFVHVPPQQQYYAPPPQQQTAQMQNENTIAVVGFILSFFVSIAGLICSIIGYNNTKKGAPNKGLAIAGIVISSVGLAISLITSFSYILRLMVLWAIFV